MPTNTSTSIPSDDESYESDTGILGSIGKQMRISKSSHRKAMRISRSGSSSGNKSNVIQLKKTILESASNKSSASDGCIASAFERLSIQDKGGFHRALLSVKDGVKSGSDLEVNGRDLVPPKIKTREDEMNKSNNSSNEMYYSTDSDHVRLGSSSDTSSVSVLMSLPSRSSAASSATATIAPFHRHEHFPPDVATNPNTPASVATEHISLSNQTPIKHKITNGIATVTATRQRSEVIKKGKWSLGEQIGCGSFGTVHRGLNQRNGSFIAVKCLNILVSDRKSIADFQREVDLMRVLTHPNIVRYLGAEVNEDEGVLYIFQEWVPGGSLASVLQKFGPLDVGVVRKYLHQVLQGLDYLHSNEIVHRDIKGGNILVDLQGQIKLADFGASKHIENGTMSSSMKGTPYFMAPEVIEERYDGKKADVWSLGGAALQMITAEPPWKLLNFRSHMSLLLHIKESSSPPPMPRNISESLRYLIEKCFDRDPHNRPSTSELFNYPFFNEEDSEDETSCSSVSIMTPVNKRDNVLTPKTPRVDIHSASRRALLRSEEKRQSGRKPYFSTAHQNTSPLHKNGTDNSSVTSNELDSKVHNIVELSNSVDDTISPLSCSGINEVWPSWTKTLIKEETNKATKQFFPPSPGVKYDQSKEAPRSLYSGELLPPITSKQIVRRSEQLKTSSRLDDRDEQALPRNICKHLPEIQRFERSNERVKCSSSGIIIGTKLPPINASGSHNAPETPLASNRRLSRRKEMRRNHLI